MSLLSAFLIGLSTTSVSADVSVDIIPEGPGQHPPGADIEFRPSSSSSSARRSDAIATLQSITLSDDGRRLIIQSDRAIATVTSGWDVQTTDYRITIPHARLADDLELPEVGVDRPLLDIRLQTLEPDTVLIWIKPAVGTQIGALESAADSRQLILALAGEPRPAPPLTAEAIADRLESIELPELQNERVLIVIDPGHGGVDPGAIGIGGLRETEVIFPISLQVAELLEQQGATVQLTRQGDRTVGLDARVQIANRANADLFVSIHANAISMSRPDVNGVETYYISNEGRRIAQFIQASLLEATGMRDRGVKSARFYVLRHTSMPAALVEVGFVTGAEDAVLLADPAFRELIAHAIARGILQYVQSQ